MVEVDLGEEIGGFYEIDRKSMKWWKKLLLTTQRIYTCCHTHLQIPICQYPWRKRGAESLNTSPGVDRRTSASKAQTAPVTITKVPIRSVSQPSSKDQSGGDLKEVHTFYTFT
ncbi:hypothetical protein QE152_g34197 [Popillia japonica]|uniref:Uncharacterized protein n=1 Tax=Popillia japonica TaxID=7064 RepID=A0AAW1IUG4_POPJA